MYNSGSLREALTVERVGGIIGLLLAGLFLSVAYFTYFTVDDSAGYTITYTFPRLTDFLISSWMLTSATYKLLLLCNRNSKVVSGIAVVTFFLLVLNANFWGTVVQRIDLPFIYEALLAGSFGGFVVIDCLLFLHAFDVFSSEASN